MSPTRFTEQTFCMSFSTILGTYNIGVVFFSPRFILIRSTFFEFNYNYKFDHQQVKAKKNHTWAKAKGPFSDSILCLGMGHLQDVLTSLLLVLRSLVVNPQSFIQPRKIALIWYL